MENSKVMMSEVTSFDSRIDFRIANPDVFRTAMQLPLNGTAYSAHRGEMASIGISIPIGKLTEKIKNAFLRLVTNSAGDVSGGTIKTNTKIVFPFVSPLTQDKFDRNYDGNE